MLIIDRSRVAWDVYGCYKHRLVYYGHRNPDFCGAVKQWPLHTRPVHVVRPWHGASLGELYTKCCPGRSPHLTAALSSGKSLKCNKLKSLKCNKLKSLKCNKMYRKWMLSLVHYVLFSVWPVYFPPPPMKVKWRSLISFLWAWATFGSQIKVKFSIVLL